jgi:hypothetical protein
MRNFVYMYVDIVYLSQLIAMRDLYPHEEICRDYFAQYIQEFGEAKLMTVREKIIESDSISGLISRSKFQMKKPTLEHFIYQVPKINYFLFAKNKTVVAGCLMALLRWNEEVNEIYEMMDEDELDHISRSIISKYRIRF